MAAFARFPKYWLSLVRYSTLISPIYALPKFNSNLMSTGCYLIGNLTQNVYNGKFFNVSNEDILTNARN